MSTVEMALTKMAERLLVVVQRLKLDPSTLNEKAQKILEVTRPSLAKRLFTLLQYDYDSITLQLVTEHLYRETLSLQPSVAKEDPAVSDEAEHSEVLPATAPSEAPPLPSTDSAPYVKSIANLQYGLPDNARVLVLIPRGLTAINGISIDDPENIFNPSHRYPIDVRHEIQDLDPYAYVYAYYPSYSDYRSQTGEIDDFYDYLREIELAKRLANVYIDFDELKSKVANLPKLVSDYQFIRNFHDWLFTQPIDDTSPSF